jgi:hypothetical protein
MEMKLYEMNAALREIIETGWVVDKETGELLFEGPQGLEELAIAREEKILSIGKIILERKSALEAFSEERKRIEAKLRAREEQQARAIAWLTGYLENNLGEGEKLKDSTCSVGWRASSSVALAADLDPRTLPDAYKRIKIEPDKTAISTALKAGEIIPGATIETRKSIAIR